MIKKNKKFSYKHILTILISVATVSIAAISLYCTFNQEQINKLVLKQNLKTFSSSNVGKKVGNIRRWQNNNFDGIEVKNGGFVVLTETQSATRIDSFGNILWEFDPNTLKSDYPSFANKKVVEIAQDEGANQNILYLLLIPKEAPDQQQSIGDPNDPHGYNDLKGSSISYKQKQATVVQIIENINSYVNNNWTPSYNIIGYMDINPEKMVNNYPKLWKMDSVSNNNSSYVNYVDAEITSNIFFTKDDHPSWYVTSKLEKVNNNVDQNINNISNTKMVLPWKQYISNLGNMFAKNGYVFIFGGNGTIFNDPEALSIGMWKLDFTKATSSTDNNQNYVGIPYAYLLRYLHYSPSNLSGDFARPNLRWDQSYAPIGQTNNFSYVPRLAIGGIQTDAASSTNAGYIYLAGGITVGQVKESQNRLGNKDSSNAVNTIQEKRSLQLTGANIVNDPKDVTANSIDPALLFGTAFNIDSLINLPLDNSENNLESFNNVLAIDSYFDVGTTMSVSSSVGTYYYFDKKNHTTTSNSSLSTDINSPYTSLNGFTRLGTVVYTGFVNGRTPFPWDYSPSFQVGEIFNFDNNNTNNNNLSYSYNLSLLIGNAINYYYSTLSFGYSLKSVGGLTKVKMPSKEDPSKTIYGYAMQVGKSIVYLNEPKLGLKDIAYHGPSSISIGDSNLVGIAKYSDMDYPYTKIGNSSITFAPSAYKSITDKLLSTGVGIYVTGIKDFNDTVPTIASSFKISEDPYTDQEFSSSKNDSTLPWNKFVGLNSVNRNSELSSLWLSNDIAKTTNNEHFIVTKQPEISEYYGDAIWKNQRLFYNVQKNSSGQISLINSLGVGEKKAWFELENDTTSYGNDFSWKTGLDNNISLNEYYVSQNNEQQINGEFDVLLKTRDDLYKTNDIFYGQIHKTKTESISYRQLIDNFGHYNYNTILEIDRLSLLGSGKFVSNLSNQILTNSLSNLLEIIDLSLITGNNLDIGTKIKIVKQEFVNDIFEISKQPYIENSQPTKGSVIIVASNENFIDQTATFTAYSWNSLTKTYDIMPRTGSQSINGINSLTFAGFSAMADWILPIIIAVPIVLVALIIGLGCGIGIPMSKHKKAIKVGFELQHEKVGTLTTAVGSVFKKIIDSTNANNIKAKPQMLKASGPKSSLAQQNAPRKSIKTPPSPKPTPKKVVNNN
ncbi:hypothetical protein [Mycoplasmoides pirum]|uniref:hypothetical protein n=1 Tax=Mycoplasmoides pirum TaxID=2122 RepID=UPI00047FC12C|nr:hypothetical protein [Mycoplasmoides pirum]